MKKTLLGFTLSILLLSNCTGNANVANIPDELDLVIRDASDYLNDNIPESSMIVILNVQSDSSALSEYIIDELIANAVNDRIFTVVDRQQLDLIRLEQNFQSSGEVDDDLALSIGKFFGAQTIVSGRVSQVGDRFRMSIRALDVQTARVQGQYNRNIVAGRTITALMRSAGGIVGGTQSTTARPNVPKSITITGINRTDVRANAGVDVISNEDDKWAEGMVAGGRGNIVNQTLSVYLRPATEAGVSDQPWTGSGEWVIRLKFNASSDDHQLAYFWRGGWKYDIQDALTTLNFADFVLVFEEGK